MPTTTLRQLLEAGVHFGHQTSRWNPKMRPYIFTARNGIHIIDLVQTQKMLDEACTVARDIVAGGQKILFVGTKKQAQDSILEGCARSGQYYVTNRWLGGLLTNFSVIQRRLATLAKLRGIRERGDFARMGTKEANVRRDDLERLERNFGGIASMERVPAALFIVDCKKERLAVTEANKLGIPIIAILDTNCDPDEIQHIIPSNDDAIRAVRLIVKTITDAIVDGQQLFAERELNEARELAEAKALAEKTAQEAIALAAAEADNADGVAKVSEAEFAGVISQTGKEA